jgi:hypothetical protein
MITQAHIKECLSDAYIRSVAAILGLNISARIKDYGVDGSFLLVRILDGGRVESGFPLAYQAKSTWNWYVDNDHIIYDM